MKLELKYPSILFILAIAIVSNVALISAQEPAGEPGPTHAEAEAEVQRNAAAGAATYAQRVAAFSFSNLRAMYFIGEAATDRSIQFATQDASEQLFIAQVVYTWDDVEKAASEVPLDILFIHNSALGEVDPAWAQQAYRNGTAIVGISTPFTELAALVGDSCVKNENSWIPEYYKEWYVYLLYRAVADPAEGKSIVDADTLENCSKKYDGLRGAATLHAALIDGISRQESLNDLMGFLRSEFVQREMLGIPLQSQLNRRGASAPILYVSGDFNAVSLPSKRRACQGLV